MTTFATIVRPAPIRLASLALGVGLLLGGTPLHAQIAPGGDLGSAGGNTPGSTPDTFGNEQSTPIGFARLLATLPDPGLALAMAQTALPDDATWLEDGLLVALPDGALAARFPVVDAADALAGLGELLFLQEAGGSLVKVAHEQALRGAAGEPQLVLTVVDAASPHVSLGLTFSGELDDPASLDVDIDSSELTAADLAHIKCIRGCIRMWLPQAKCLWVKWWYKSFGPFGTTTVTHEAVYCAVFGIPGVTFGVAALVALQACAVACL